MPLIDTTEVLADLQKRTEYCISEAKKLRKKGVEVLNHAPSQNAWSAAQCMNHLNQYGNFYLPEIKNRIEASTYPPHSHFKPGFIGNMFAKSMLDRPGMTKMSSPANMTPPKSTFELAEVDTFIEQQKQYLELIQLAKNVSLNRTKVSITLSKWFKINLGDVLRVNIFHNQRHINQAVRAAKSAK